MRNEQVFDMMAKEMGRLPDGSNKYALLGFFRELQQQHGEPRDDGTVAEVTPLASVPSGRNTQAMTACRTTAPAGWQTVIVQSTLTDWLLGFIAFLLILQLITR